MPELVTPSGSQKAINFWLAARILTAISILIVTIRPWKKLQYEKNRYLFLSISILLVILVYWVGLYQVEYLPVTFVDGVGLTPFKIFSEYFIMAIFALSALILYQKTKTTPDIDLSPLFAAVILAILSELCFTLYTSVSDVYNLLGHIYKVLSFAYIYQAVFVMSVREPFQRVKDAERTTKKQFYQLEESRKRIEIASQEWTAVFDAVNTPIFLHDKDYRLMRVNRAYLLCTNLDYEEIVGRPYWEVFPKMDGPTPACAQLLELQLDEQIEELHLESGEIYTSRGFAVKGGDGKYLFSVHVMEDITESRRDAEKLRKLSRAVEQSADSIMITDTEGVIEYANPHFTKVTGYSLEEVIGETPTILKSGNTIPSEYQQLWASITSGKSWRGELQNRRKDGSLFWEMATIAPLHDREQNITHFVATKKDITEQKAVERSLQESEAKFKNLAEQSLMGIYLIQDDVFKYVNPGLAAIFGYSQEEMIHGVGPKDVVLNEDWPLVKQNLHKHYQGEVLSLQYDFRGLTKSGDIINIEVFGSRTLYDGQPAVVGGLLDISSRKAMELKLEYQATHDTLTALYNRNKFETLLQKMLSGSLLEKGNQALLYLDLDQFKVVNDTCGHTAGDVLLRQLSNLLKADLCDACTIARLGGDEFGVLVDSCTLESATAIAQSLLDTINTFHFIWQDKHFDIGASIGLVMLESELKSDVSGALGAADSACYIAKDLGRNRIHVYQWTDKDLTTRRTEMNWVSPITQAIQHDQLQLWRQKIVPLTANGKTHYEVLVRMELEDNELVPPGVFIPIAERYGLAPAIDRWVIRNTIALLGERAELDCVTGINLSGASFTDESLPAYIEKLLVKYTVAPELICFEVTETAAITNLIRAQVFITTMRSLGCSFALDDFGSGMSSFAYLKNLEVDYLKIDGEFVRNIDTSKVDRAMVQAINQVGKAMGIQTIAEFVESEEILAELTAIGVDYGQGYVLHKPELWCTE